MFFIFPSCSEGLLAVDDHDDPDDEVEFSRWRQREIARIRRTMQDRESYFRAQEELRHRDQLTDEDRAFVVPFTLLSLHYCTITDI